MLKDFTDSKVTLFICLEIGFKIAHFLK